MAIRWTRLCPDARGMAQGGGHQHFTVSQALRTRAFWLLAIAMAFANAVQSAMIVHQFPRFETLVGREQAVWAIAELNIFNMAGRVVGGVLETGSPSTDCFRRIPFCTGLSACACLPTARRWQH